MSEVTKIHLSALEMELVTNTQWVFTKQIIIDKVYHMFGKLHEEYKEIVLKEKKFIPLQLQKPGGKIAKGENYNGLPYLILDFPAIYSKENIFAIRTMFWWGNFFSISLHLSGDYCNGLANIRECLIFLKEKDFFICVNENEWKHDFDSSNFININELEKDQIALLSRKRFFKIAKKIELAQWEFAIHFLKQTFEEIMEFIKFSFPNGEKVL